MIIIIIIILIIITESIGAAHTQGESVIQGRRVSGLSETTGNQAIELISLLNSSVIITGILSIVLLSPKKLLVSLKNENVALFFVSKNIRIFIILYYRGKITFNLIFINAIKAINIFVEIT